MTFDLQQWEVKAPMPSQAMRGAVKQITKLHESLSLVLPETQVEVTNLLNVFRKTNMSQLMEDCTKLVVFGWVCAKYTFLLGRPFRDSTPREFNS